MDEFKKISSSEWGAPYQGSKKDPLSDLAQRHKAGSTLATVAAVLERDERPRIEGVDIPDDHQG